MSVNRISAIAPITIVIRPSFVEHYNIFLKFSLGLKGEHEEG